MPSGAPRPPPRLFVIMAREHPSAVVLRRGPSGWYHLVRWHTRSDTFEDGAWLRGRIYEDRCDLSPDGALFVYMCHQGSRIATEYTDAYTAVSRPPWLHALALWPWGSTWGGGGRFVDARTLELRAGQVPDHHPEHPPTGLVVRPGAAERHASTNEVEGADWTGRDHDGHLVLCRDGRLYRRRGSTDTELRDFTPLTPEPSPPPEWATRRL